MYTARALAALALLAIYFRRVIIQIACVQDNFSGPTTILSGFWIASAQDELRMPMRCFLGII